MINDILEEEIRATLIEGIYDANLREIETYHRIGKALIQAKTDGLKLKPNIPQDRQGTYSSQDRRTKT